MANPSPHKARQGRRKIRLRKIGDLADARREVWRAMRYCRQLLEAEDSASVRLKAANSISQLSMSYIRLYEATELEARVSALESLVEARKEVGYNVTS